MLYFENEAFVHNGGKTTVYQWIKSKPQLLSENINPSQHYIYTSVTHNGSVNKASSKICTTNFKSFDTDRKSVV